MMFPLPPSLNHNKFLPCTLGIPSVARVCVHSASGSRKSDCSPCIIIKYQLAYPHLTSLFIGSALIHDDAAASICFPRAGAARSARVLFFGSPRRERNVDQARERASLVSPSETRSSVFVLRTAMSMIWGILYAWAITKHRDAPEA